MKHSINPEVSNPIRFEKNVGEPEGPREFLFDPHQGKMGTLYTYESVAGRGNYEEHGSLNGAIPINENSTSSMLCHYWMATLEERISIRLDAGYDHDDDEVDLPPQQGPEDIDQIENNGLPPGKDRFNAEVHSQTQHTQQGNQQEMDMGPGDPQLMLPNVIPIELGEYIQTRDVVRSQGIALTILTSLLKNKLEPDAHEFQVIDALLLEVERAKGNVYESAE